MLRLTGLVLGCLLITPAMAQEDPWQKFLREHQEYTDKQLADADAKVEASRKTVLDSVRGIRSPALVPAQPQLQSQLQPQPQPVPEIRIKTLTPVDQPLEDRRVKTYLINTPTGIAQCRFVAGIAFCH